MYNHLYKPVIIGMSVLTCIIFTRTYANDRCSCIGDIYHYETILNIFSSQCFLKALNRKKEGGNKKKDSENGMITCSFDMREK